MQSDMEGTDTFMKIEGKMVYILSHLDPSLYKEHATIENGKKVLYVKLKNPCMAPYRLHFCFGKT